MMVQSNDKRHIYVMKDLILPITIAATIGISSSFIGVRLAVSTLEVDMTNIKGDVIKLENIMEAVTVQGKELSARGQWMQSTDRRLSVLEARAVEEHRTVSRILETRYTPEDAVKDRQLLVSEIEKLLQRIPQT